LPTESFIQFEIGFERGGALDEDDLRKLIDSHGFSMRDLSYRLYGSPQILEYQTVIWTSDVGQVRALERSLLGRPGVVHFRLSPSRD
jgi:putative Mg2+ transporter-C (MgtC) family protein